MTKSIAEMQAEVHAINIEKGWFDDERSFGDGIALLHSEASEALEAYRDFHDVETRFEVKADLSGHGFGAFVEGDVIPTLPTQRPDFIGFFKPVGVGSEYADILIRLLDQCERDGVDLEREYETKIAFNRTRPHKHGGKTL